VEGGLRGKSGENSAHLLHTVQMNAIMLAERICSGAACSPSAPPPIYWSCHRPPPLLLRSGLRSRRRSRGISSYVLLQERLAEEVGANPPPSQALWAIDAKHSLAHLYVLCNLGSLAMQAEVGSLSPVVVLESPAFSTPPVAYDPKALEEYFGQRPLLVLSRIVQVITSHTNTTKHVSKNKAFSPSPRGSSTFATPLHSRPLPPAP
jgi:hypothetical protein